MEDVGEKLELLARCITKKACKRWPTLLAHIKDEVYSEALVAAVQSQNKKKPHEKDNRLTWPPWQDKYAYGQLIGALRTQKYLPPNRQKNKPNKGALTVKFNTQLLENSQESFVESAEIQSNIRSHARWLLKTLDKNERRMMILHIYGGYDLAELALKFNVSRMTITTWKKNALIKMRVRERIRAEENNEN